MTSTTTTRGYGGDAGPAGGGPAGQDTDESAAT